MKWSKLATGVDEDCYWSECLQLEWKTCVETNSLKSVTELPLFCISTDFIFLQYMLLNKDERKKKADFLLFCFVFTLKKLTASVEQINSNRNVVDDA